MLELGRALVEELGLDPGVDTLSRWMAHYIAELIETAEAAHPQDRPEEVAKCAAAILSLWQRRHELPDGKRPLEDLEPVLRALKTLDPADNTPRYFQPGREAVGDARQSAKSREAISLVEGLDHSAKILIRHYLTQAARPALRKSKKWTKLIEAAGIQDSAFFRIVRFISSEDQLLAEPTAGDQARKELEERAERLESFSQLATDLAAQIRRQLA